MLVCREVGWVVLHLLAYPVNRSAVQRYPVIGGLVQVLRYPDRLQHAMTASDCEECMPL